MTDTPGDLNITKFSTVTRDGYTITETYFLANNRSGGEQRFRVTADTATADGIDNVRVCVWSSAAGWLELIVLTTTDAPTPEAAVDRAYRFLMTSHVDRP